MELLSPAGSFDALKNAVWAGADAVYFGVGRFNARAKAENASQENISDWIDFCHLYGVKAYVAINISIKETEFKNLEEVVRKCSQAKVDAFIVSDFSAAKIIAEISPQTPLHASTQMGIHNAEGARYAKDLGFDRVILARETPLCEMKRIKEEVDIEIEVFVHGAMCVCFSGNCYLSSMMSGQSGNRGRCTQPCRLNYRFEHGEQKFIGNILSAPDIDLHRYLQELQMIGIDSLKVEGRLKRAEYTAIVTKIYKSILKNNLKYNNADEIQLKKVYNRGNLSNGYLFDHQPKFVLQHVGHKGVLAGKVIERKGKIEIVFSELPKKGNGYKILRKGEEVGGFTYGNNEIPLHKLKWGDEIYLTTDQAQFEEVNKLQIKSEIPISLTVRQNEPIAAQILGETIFSNFIVQKAIRQPISPSDIYNCFLKSGESEIRFRIEKLMHEQEVFFPISALNAFRRECYAKCRQILLDRYNAKQTQRKKPCMLCKDQVDMQKESMFKSAIEIDETIRNDFDFDYFDYIVYNPSDYTIQHPLLENIDKKKLFLKLPTIAFKRDIELISNFIKSYAIENIFANNLYGVELARNMHLGLFLGEGMNIYNKQSLSAFGEKCLYMNSIELNFNEIDKNGFTFAYGRLPVMTLRHCFYKELDIGNCAHCLYQSTDFLSDGKYRYPIRRTKADKCIFTLYNPIISNINKKKGKIESNIYINMIKSNENDMIEILKGATEGDFTYGHLFRGVE